MCSAPRLHLSDATAMFEENQKGTSMSSFAPTRRGLLAATAAIALSGVAPALAEELPKMVVHRSPTCGCCKAWVSHLRSAGFTVDVIDEADIASVKTRLRVPAAIASCHTAEVGGYVVEGHAPAVAVRRLLEQKPNAIGLAVPGMPIGSPGMEAGGEVETYDVLLFDGNGWRSFAKFEGGREI